MKRLAIIICLALLAMWIISELAQVPFKSVLVGVGFIGLLIWGGLTKSGRRYGDMINENQERRQREIRRLKRDL